jgi:hypothetical protein
MIKQDLEESNGGKTVVGIDPCSEFLQLAIHDNSHRNVASGLRHRFRGRYAETSGYRCYRSSLHIGFPFSRSYTDGLFPPLAPIQ